MIHDDEVILTHCNAGSLATVAYGTALGVLRAASDMGKNIRVIATETRPVMQGSRLTAFELNHYGIDFSLIPDTAVGHLMSSGLINRVIVGADRVLKSGHVYNKIGTYQVAALAKRHNIPFYVAAPSSTFDLTSKVSDVVIEERNKNELLKMGNKLLAPKGIKVFNPAFDVTPPELITGIITEKGVIKPPYEETITKNILSDG
jgi:methylthioribose-1-phosphate isomerase